MELSKKKQVWDPIFIVAVLFLYSASYLILNSLEATIFPQYFVFMALGLAVFYLFAKIDFSVLLAFSRIIYYVSIILLVIPLILGTTTRGVIRWIPIGSFSIQPSEIVRPFLILFFAGYLTERKINIIRFSKVMIYFAVPFILILIQPSLGVALLTAASFLGVLFASSIKKSYIFTGIVLFVLMIPVLWLFLAPYQKQRISSFIDPGSDPFGAGYNSIQAMISVGSGKLLGRGLGDGVQTQLFFLPEDETDFIFAAVSEELGFLGSALILIAYLVLFWRLTDFVGDSQGPPARAYLSGIFTVLLAEVFIHIGMNMGLMPITGVPLPLLSAGGSALVGTMIGFGIAISARK